MFESTIRQADPDVPVKIVHATRGKHIRAEPVSLICEQGRIHCVGHFPLLEDQCAEYDPTLSNQPSPDRMDSMVWGFSSLIAVMNNDGIMRYYERMSRERAALPSA